MFGIDIIDAGLLPGMFVALLAGVISFLSPCVLPIVPPYLAYMSGVNVGDMSSDAAARRKTILSAVFFVLGLSTVFLVLGFTASAFGTFFLQNQTLFAQIAGVVVIIFGLHFLSVFRIPFLDQEARLDAGDQGGSSFGAYILGLAFAFGWTPCIGPQLGAILTIAASEGSVSRGTLLLGVYAAGIGHPVPAGGDVHVARDGPDEPAEAAHGYHRKVHGRAAGAGRARAGDRCLHQLQLVVA